LVVNASVHLIGKLTRATVGIHAAIPESHPSVLVLGNQRGGTGTIVDASGLILTVNYVVLGAERITATSIDGKVYEGHVVAQDFSTGIAVVKVHPPRPLPTAPVRSSQSVAIGQEVVVVASVGGEKRRANNGNVTFLGPFDAYWEYTLERSIVTSAVNPGFGGGPLFDLLGNMIGVVSLDLGEVGRFSFAIPVDYYLEYRDELLRFGKRISAPAQAWVGLYCYTFRDHVVIAGLLPGSPGEEAGLRTGDVILAVDGQPISTRAELYRCLWDRRPGDKLIFRVFRNNEVHHVEVASGSIEEFFA